MPAVPVTPRAERDRGCGGTSGSPHNCLFPRLAVYEVHMFFPVGYELIAHPTLRLAPAAWLTKPHTRAGTHGVLIKPGQMLSFGEANELPRSAAQHGGAGGADTGSPHPGCPPGLRSRNRNWETSRRRNETRCWCGGAGDPGASFLLSPRRYLWPCAWGTPGRWDPHVTQGPFHLLQVGRETPPPAKLKLSGAVWSLKHLPGAKLAAGKFKACVGKIMCQQSSESALRGGQGGRGERAAWFVGKGCGAVW